MIELPKKEGRSCTNFLSKLYCFHSVTSIKLYIQLKNDINEIIGIYIYIYIFCMCGHLVVKFGHMHNDDEQ